MSGGWWGLLQPLVPARSVCRITAVAGNRAERFPWTGTKS